MRIADENLQPAARNPRLFGLIGFPLEHSFSKKYFEEKFKREGITDCAFENFPIESAEALPELISTHPDLCGLSVTIPYKEKCMEYLDEINETVQEIGAANCIKVSDGITTGYNTDFTGFMNSILPLIQTHHNLALVLGTGGSAKAVAYGLGKMGIDVIHAARNPKNENEIAESAVDEKMLRDCKLIINCTPVGLFPHLNECPDIPYAAITPMHLLFDLIYNPAETLFLKKGKEQGAVTKNGEQMLHLQADASWLIWNG